MQKDYCLKYKTPKVNPYYHLLKVKLCMESTWSTNTGTWLDDIIVWLCILMDTQLTAVMHEASPI